jgi:protein TonB
MATSLPLPAAPLGTSGVPRSLVATSGRAAPAGAWRYSAVRRSRPLVVTAALASAGIHAGLLFGLGHAAKKPAFKSAVPTIQLTITMPQLKELDEPDPAPTDDDAKPDLGQPVPMQADVPSVALPTDFVQQFDFASLVERPDLSDLKLVSLPEHIARPGKLMEGVKIFDLASLDRIPEAIVQTPPVYPPSLRRDHLVVTVKVLFHVEIDGHVSNARVIESEDQAFDEAALAGVAKWKFRPGIKDGRKVVTRVTVPITFRTTDAVD